MSKTTRSCVFNRENAQLSPNQQDNPTTHLYVNTNQQQTAKARQAALVSKRQKLFSEYETRLQRMGLGDQAATDRHIVQYGEKYLPTTKTFNYGNPTLQFASIFGTRTLSEDLNEIEQLMIAESQPIRFSNTPNFWPNAEVRHVNYRECVVGGKAPTKVAGNYNHSDQQLMSQRDDDIQTNKTIAPAIHDSQTPYKGFKTRFAPYAGCKCEYKNYLAECETCYTTWLTSDTAGVLVGEL